MQRSSLHVVLHVVVAIAVAALGACTAPEAPSGDVEALAAATADWHAERLARLEAPDGWLSLVGLAWLYEGPNTVGAAADSDVAYAGFPVERVGVLSVEDGVVRFEAARGLAIDGFEAIQELATDADGSPDVVTLGDVRFHVIDRGGRLGVRIKDATAPTRLEFEGLERFPVDADWRLEGRFEPAAFRERTDTVIGTPVELEVTGRVRFERDGVAVDAVLYGGPATYSLRFADASSGSTTYAIGRYLELPAPDPAGRVVLDFNRAYNPPCSLTPFATCTLAPESNRFPFAIEAGERFDS